jgi:hypothetical protein
VLILVLFVSALLKLEAGWLSVAIVCLSASFHYGSLLAVIRDMNLALETGRLEIGE